MQVPFRFHRVQQTRFGNPRGNCYEASIASVLGLRLEDVPDRWVAAGCPTDPLGPDDHVESFTEAWMQRWYERIGVSMVVIDWRAGLGMLLPPGLICIGYGPAASNGIGHEVVMIARRGEDGVVGLELLHDPHVEDGWTPGLRELEGLRLYLPRSAEPT